MRGGGISTKEEGSSASIRRVAPTSQDPASASGAAADDRPVSFGEAFRFWLKLGFINFGGPAGQIAIMHRELVERHRWVGEAQFLRALNFCMILPGPEAQQLATYIGWRLHGYRGGLVAGAFFVLPSVFVLLVLSWLAAAYGDVPAVQGLLYGVGPVVIALVVDALLRIAGRTLGHPLLVGFAFAAFAAIYALGLLFPVVVGAAALAGLLLSRRWPDVFRARTHGSGGWASEAVSETGSGPASVTENGAVSATASGPGNPSAMELRRPSLRRSAAVAAIFVLLWAVPFGALLAWRGAGDVLVHEFLFFTQTALVTFGGAYAVLAYIAEVAVNQFGWLDAQQMIQGLALAESTPGPLIMVTQYVGFFGAYQLAGEYPPLLNGVLGGLVTTYATFLPSFLFIFLMAPYIELLADARLLQAALVGVTAAVVGVIANLAVFFTTRVLFPGVVSVGGLDLLALAIALFSFAILRRTRVPVHVLVPIGALVGLVAAVTGLV
ncbi:chromate transporter [soil metagenome]